MKTIALTIAGLLLLACQSPTGYPSTTTTPSTPAAPAATTFSVTYKNTTVNTTGSVPVDSTSYASGATVTVLGNTGNLSWPPFVFVGWNTQNNGGSLGGGGGTAYLPGATFTITANVVLYGTWK